MNFDISQIVVIFDLSKSRNYRTTGIEAFEHKGFALLVDCVSSILPPIISLKIVEDEVLCPTFCGDRRNHQRGKVEMFMASVCFPIIGFRVFPHHCSMLYSLTAIVLFHHRRCRPVTCFAPRWNARYTLLTVSLHQMQKKSLTSTSVLILMSIRSAWTMLKR